MLEEARADALYLANEKIEDSIENRLIDEMENFKLEYPQQINQALARIDELYTWFYKLEFENVIIVDTVEEIPAESNKLKMVSRLDNPFAYIIGLEDKFETRYFVCFRDILKAMEFIEMHTS